MSRWAGSAPVGTAIRAPAVAGSFYPSEPDLLAALVDQLLAEAGRLAGASDPGERMADRPLVGLLVPTRGWSTPASSRRPGGAWSGGPGPTRR